VVTGRRIHALLALVCCGLWLPAAMAQSPRLIASVDRASVRENESFTYTLRADGDLSGQPDLSALSQDFDLLDMFRSTNLQIVNGRTTRTAEWVVPLMPRRTGTFTLPAAELDGVRSNTVTVEVLPAAAADAQTDAIFMEVELDRPTAYVQSEVIYTLRLFVGIGTGPATLTMPLIEGGEAIVEKLGTDRQYRTLRGGVDFTVHERSYAIFPESPGTLSVGPVVFEALVQQSRGLAQNVRLRSDIVELDVKPAVPPPPAYPNAVWLPASTLEIEDSWSSSAAEFVQGVPQTRTLTMTADGLLETQLPALSLSPSPLLRQYPDQPELSREVTANGIVSERTERFAVIAQQAGTIELPAVELPWWNVDQERWEVARVEPRSIEVRADQTAVAPPLPETGPRTVAVTERDPGAWPWISAALAGGWLATIAVWLFSSRRGQKRRPAPRTARPPSIRQLLKQLLAACRVNDPQRTRELLLAWGARQFADDPPASLGVLAGRLTGPLAAEIETLEAALYGRQVPQWQGQRLAGLLQQTQSVVRRGGSDGEDPLVPLYR
jgi:hypothetical protein